VRRLLGLQYNGHTFFTNVPSLSNIQPLFEESSARFIYCCLFHLILKAQSAILSRIIEMRYNSCVTPKYFPFPMGDPGPHLIRDSLGPPHSIIIRTSARSVQPFL